MHGQITLNDPFGNFLYRICLQQNIKTVVEIGTWYGMGSTECIIRGLSDSGRPDVSFISLESDKNMYKVAVDSWKGKLPSWAKLTFGHIVGVEDLDTENLGQQNPDELKWFESDKQAIVDSPYVLSQIPEKIDFLLLDGGEFSTQAEWEILKNRSNIVALDDTTVRKCMKIREFVMKNQDMYQIILDEPNFRNGAMVFQKKS